ncbi:hypothetical protein M406DRAFT_238536, partial [Cryphonectria parasitica EP155]
SSSDGVSFFGCQLGDQTVINYSYTDNPWRLLACDTYNFVYYIWALPYILLPYRPTDSGDLSELAPTPGNLFCILIHTILIVLQLVFLLVVPPLALFIPLWTTVLIVGAFMALNSALSALLNGKDIVFHSDPTYAAPNQPKFAHEQWIFLNGVAVGSHWMRSNLNRLALTFGRPVVGIHNRTSGILFDVIECLVQRNFGYATNDIRLCYRILKEKLYNPQYHKVVFILHSQGGIEGGMVLDWLLQELPQNLLCKLEVYTFGNAANHFNNPYRTVRSEAKAEETPSTSFSFSSTTSPSDHTTSSSPPARAIRHIEHYAYTTDFVALWGVLHFATIPPATHVIPRFLGRLFERASPDNRGGHQLVQHYLDGMFPLQKDSVTGQFVGCAETNAFMESVVRVPQDHNAGGGGVVGKDDAQGGSREGVIGSWEDEGEPNGGVEVQNGGGSPVMVRQDTGMPVDRVRVKELSRLWKYRNGRSPGE